MDNPYNIKSTFKNKNLFFVNGQEVLEEQCSVDSIFCPVMIHGKQQGWNPKNAWSFTIGSNDTATTKIQYTVQDTQQAITQIRELCAQCKQKRPTTR